MFTPEDVKIELVIPVVPRGSMSTGKLGPGVKVTHIPTGIVVVCDDFRQMHKNRVEAIERLSLILDAHG